MPDFALPSTTLTHSEVSLLPSITPHTPLFSRSSDRSVTTLPKSVCQTEIEVSILKFLESCVVSEGEDVRFECLVSRDEAPLVQWKLQDVPLQDNEMNVIGCEGRLHSLTLRGVTQADSGTVTFTVGSHTSTASLTVKGKKPAMWLIFFSRLNSFFHPF